MAVACAFDRWRKDVLFPAAEAVQESADIMQSTYRMWMRERSRSSESETMEPLQRELVTALGTAKWQLEEFVRAIKATRRNYSPEDHNVALRRQFVDAIGEQISQVEKALEDPLKGGVKAGRWVHLDEEECKDLASFLSSVKQSEQRESVGSSQIQEVGRPTRSAIEKGFRENLTSRDDSKYIVELGMEEVKNPACSRWLAGEQRTWSSPDMSDWKIVISDDGSKGNALKNRFQPPFQFINLYGLLKNTRMDAKSKWSKRNIQEGKNDMPFSKRSGFASYLGGRMISRFVQGGKYSSPTNINNSGGCEGLKGIPIRKTWETATASKRQLKGLRHFTKLQSLRFALLPIIAVFLLVLYVFNAN